VGDPVVFQCTHNVLVKTWNVFNSCSQLLEVHRHYWWAGQPVRQHSLHLLNILMWILRTVLEHADTTELPGTKIYRTGPYFNASPHCPGIYVGMHNCPVFDWPWYVDLKNNKSYMFSTVYIVVLVKKNSINKTCPQNFGGESLLIITCLEHSEGNRRLTENWA
jgi:hypothetical protein